MTYSCQQFANDNDYNVYNTVFGQNSKLLTHYLVVMQKFNIFISSMLTRHHSLESQSIIIVGKDAVSNTFDMRN